MGIATKSTIRDVARACGLSAATVSNVLNGRKDLVRPDTRDRVLDAVRRLQYRPAAADSSADRHGVRNLGVLMYASAEEPIVGVPYFALLLDGILRSAGDHNWSVQFFVQSMWTDAEKSIREFCDGRCAGLIVISPSEDCSIVQALLARGIPLVTVGGGNAQHGASTVDVDNFEGMRVATRHLISLGHTGIVHLAGTGNNSATEREAGYVSAMTEAGLEPVTWPGSYGYESGARLATEWRETARLVGATAVACANDESAAGFIKSASDLGIRVPDDVSVTGFDAFPVGTPPTIPITSVRNPLQAIGKRAVRALIDAAASPLPARETIRFPAELVPGRSAATLRPSHATFKDQRR
jgi:DNA-binding LacI/PurR family transcriptional regulator